jgi:hypothetical protein
MKKLLYLILLTFSIACSKSDPEPDALGVAIGNPELAAYLSGTWNYSYTGKGLIYWSESLSFDLKSKQATRTVLSNMNETLSNPKTTRISYDVEGRGEIITLKVGTFSTTYRIEKISEARMNVYERLGGSELDVMIYKRAK